MRLNIALLPGDGIGVEVVEAAVSVLDVVGERFGHHFAYTNGLIGAAAIKECGNPYPSSTHDICTQCDAVLLGAVGDVAYDNNPHSTVRPEQGLLAMRRALGLYANLRPISIYKELANVSPLKNEVVANVDCLFVRELTSGIYFGDHIENKNDATDVCRYTTIEIDRILKVGFEQALVRRHKLTLVDKANVLATSRLWRQRAQLMASLYPAVSVDYMYVDNAAMQIVSNPSQFDVIVTENMFGDILTDLASVISGSIGLLPSASIGDTYSLFEPIHGSWPSGAGTGKANPIGAILSASMMLSYKGLGDEALAIKNGVQYAISTNTLTPELGGKSTTIQIAKTVSQWIASH